MGEAFPPAPPLNPAPFRDDPLLYHGEPRSRRPSRRRSFIQEIRPEDPAMGLYDDFGRMDIRSPHKEEKKEKKEDKYPIPFEKPGTIVAYECYRFTKLESWEKASRQKIFAPDRELEAKVKSQRGNGRQSILDQMTKMSTFRAEQINRLVEDKNASTKDPNFEWACAYIGGKKVSTKKYFYEVPSMDVIVVKMVKKRSSSSDKKEPKLKIPGELIDLSKKPEKEKKEKDKKGEKGEEQGHFQHDGHMWGNDPFFTDHPRPFEVHNHQPAQPDPGFINLGPVQDHGGVQIVPEGGHHEARPMYEHAPPPAPMAPPPPRRRRSRHRPAPIPDPVLDVGGQNHHHNSSIDDDISVFFDDDGRSSRTSHSIDFEKHIPRRGSLRPERRKSYREHHRHNSYSTYPRHNDYPSSGEFAELIPERTTRPRNHRPEMTRRRTVAYYVPPQREITYHQEDLIPTVSHRSYSPPGGLDFGRVRTEREIEDLERELELRDREERLLRRERSLDRQAEVKRLDLLDRLTRRSTGRDPYGYRI